MASPRVAHEIEAYLQVLQDFCPPNAHAIAECFHEALALQSSSVISHMRKSSRKFNRFLEESRNTAIRRVGKKEGDAMPDQRCRLIAFDFSSCSAEPDETSSVCPKGKETMSAITRTHITKLRTVSNKRIFE